MSRLNRSFSSQPWLLALLLLIFAIFSSNTGAASANISEQLNQLDEQFKQLSMDYYKAQNTSNQPVISSIDKLQTQVNNFKLQQQPVKAVQLLYANINTVKRYIDHPSSFEFIALLLQQNEWKLATTIYDELINLDERSLLAAARFEFAKYHADRHQWQQVAELLDGQLRELSKETIDYAYLLQGTALQNLKKHRQASESYKKINSSSKYYEHAQLNKAITDIRQGWWSDAQSTIDTLLANTTKDNSNELINRLNLVLGYALLQHEYYRNARQAFRRIGLQSHYTNRALLGITLSATSQGDYIGGLNALKILKNNVHYDLSVDESYLLFPYVYEKLQQQVTVTASYTEAMEHYQSRISHLKASKSINYDLVNAVYDETNSSITIKNTIFDIEKKYPQSFFSSYKNLQQLINNTSSQRLLKKMTSLQKKYQKAYNLMLDEMIDERVEYLNSYLNQSRYGLARLYDNNQATN